MYVCMYVCMCMLACRASDKPICSNWAPHPRGPRKQGVSMSCMNDVQGSYKTIVCRTHCKTDVWGPWNTSVRISLHDWCAGPLQDHCVQDPLQDRCVGPLQLKTKVLGPLQDQCATKTYQNIPTRRFGSAVHRKLYCKNHRLRNNILLKVLSATSRPSILSV